MGLHEPDYVNEHPPDDQVWRCLDCGHAWAPDDLVSDDHLVWYPAEKRCPACGSEETDEE